MASKQIRFALVLHNHQPVGNFEHVFQQAYQDSYEPLLDVLSRYETLKLSMHVSGSLIEWLSTNHPDYLERLADLVARGRLEILGGAFYEPILAMIPSRDRIGQIRSFTRWLEDRLGATVRGMWVPERVWEQSFVRDIVAAGIEYTVLDDFHFKNAGLVESQLYGPYLTEDDGQVMTIFPGSERLRYLIPFAEPQETLDYLGRIANERSDAVVVFGDDGEKFGTWPGTHKHVYTDRWLERFFDLLVENQDWIRLATLAEAADNAPPLGKIYLPESSYREMTEWVLPVEQQLEYERIAHDMSQDLRWPAMRRFMRGGYWRNFKARYPEADEMYARMMAVSRRLGQLVEDGTAGEPIDQARTELYRAQCNCAYWHGAFGGLYLPHLRNAVYHHLIAAEGLMDQATRPAGPWVEAKIEDFNFDGRQEVQLANDRLCALLAPGRGGQMYELDVRAIRHNLLATLARRPEAYHRKVLAGSNQAGEQVASIHDRVVCKQEGLDKWIHYDQHLRKSLLDHFFDREATLEAVAGAQAPERGDFLASVYEARVRRNPDRIQVLLIREGNAAGHAVRITKGVILSAGNSTLEIAYLLEGLPKDQPLHFGVELNFAGLPAGADDRYFRDSKQKRLGQLGSRLDLHDVKGLGLVDEWLGIDAGLSFSRPTHLWTFPIETVSQSEGGFELVHQSVVVLPHWLVSADAEGRWTATVHLALDTSRAESRAEQNALAATV
jgi:alpha-amylase